MFNFKCFRNKTVVLCVTLLGCYGPLVGAETTQSSFNTTSLNYCAAHGGGSYEWIQSVTLDGDTYSSGGAGNDNNLQGYSDFTAKTFTASDGQMQLTPGFSGQAYSQFWTVWVDLNQDGIFSDSEKLLDGLSGNASTNGVLALPVVSQNLTTRMRVVMRYGGEASSACGNIGSGEVEDYSLLIPADSAGQLQLQDTCKTQGASTNSQLADGVAICLPDAQVNYFSIPGANNYNSIAISTGHGSGDLSLFAKNGGWPATNGTDPGSTNAGNSECVILQNPSQYWTYVAVTGEKQGASIVADLGATSCRTVSDEVDPTDPVDPPSNGNDGYPYDSVNVKIFRFQFSDAPLTWTEQQIITEMEKVKTYYTEQSYGRFTVTYDLSQPIITIPESKSNYDNDFQAWRALWRAKVAEQGVDPDAPGAGNIIMMTAPQVGNFNSSAAPPEMSIYHYGAGTVAHEIGHALGLRHAKAVEAGPGKIIGNGDIASESLNYGNVYSMMGMGAHSLQEYNLMYKDYFGWLTAQEVPLINQSGTYRLYAFDHGSASGTNAPGYIGIKLKSGNDKYTYWLEYRTTHNTYTNTKNGVLINLQGYLENEQDPGFWKHTSHLLDMTPGSKTPGWWGDDQTDSELVIGESYTDHWGGFRITVLQKGGVEDTAQAWIDVQVEML